MSALDSRRINRSCSSRWRAIFKLRSRIGQEQRAVSFLFRVCVSETLSHGFSRFLSMILVSSQSADRKYGRVATIRRKRNDYEFRLHAPDARERNARNAWFPLRERIDQYSLGWSAPQRGVVRDRQRLQNLIIISH